MTTVPLPRPAGSDGRSPSASTRAAARVRSPAAARPSDQAVLQRLQQLSGGRPLVVHLYTAWSWHGDWVDAEIQKYSAAGYDVALTVKYSPPAGHDGDVAGYESFVRTIARKYASNPRLVSLCIGNEANAYGNPDASDGPFKSSTSRSRAASSRPARRSPRCTRRPGSASTSSSTPTRPPTLPSWRS